MKRTIFSMILCLILGLTSLGQNHTWSIGISGGPSHMSLINTARGDNSPAIIQHRAKFYQPNGYRIGIGPEKQISEHWSLHSGLLYQTNAKESACYIPPGGIGNEQGTDYVQWGVVSEKLNYICLPLHAIYQLSISKRYNISAYAKGGVSVYRLINYYSESQEILGSPIGIGRYTLTDGQEISYNVTGYDKYYYTTGNIYTPWVISGDIELGINLKYQNRQQLRLGIGYSHVLSKVDNKNVYVKGLLFDNGNQEWDSPYSTALYWPGMSGFKYYPVETRLSYTTLSISWLYQM